MNQNRKDFNAPAIFLIAIGAFFPELINTISGVRNVDSIYIRAATNLGAGRLTLFRRVMELLAERDASDIVVFGGGIIPAADIAELETLGVARIFTPGATTASIIEWVRANVATPVS